MTTKKLTPRKLKPPPVDSAIITGDTSISAKTHALINQPMVYQGWLSKFVGGVPAALYLSILMEQEPDKESFGWFKHPTPDDFNMIYGFSYDQQEKIRNYLRTIGCIDFATSKKGILYFVNWPKIEEIHLWYQTYLDWFNKKYTGQSIAGHPFHAILSKLHNPGLIAHDLELPRGMHI